tara:strand:+ start:113 stop:943 length:831 start_codon:yes stop_codon:yes gene_type:complete
MNNFIKDHLNLIKKYNIPSPELELRTLLNNCLLNNEVVFLNNFNINKINIQKFKSAFQRRLNYEPLSKIFNKKEFWSLNFYVNQCVLDPRPESEFLIQVIKKYFNNLKSNIKICDLGTGSGCLAITLAKIYNKSKITATDISKEALEIANKNAEKHYVTKQIKFINCDWFSNNERFDFVLSNPPYLSYNEYERCEINVKNFEPKIALVGGLDGLESYRQISNIVHSILNNNSFLFIEIGKSQTANVKNIFVKKNLKLIEIVKDYQQIDRVLVLKKI